MDAVQFEKIRAAYRELGPNALAISKAVGKHRSTVTRALREGFPKLGLPPICPVRPASPDGADGSSAGGSFSGSVPAAATATGAGSRGQTALGRAAETAAAGTNLALGQLVVATRVLKKLEGSIDRVLSRANDLDENGKPVVSLKEFMHVFRELSKIHSASVNALVASAAEIRTSLGMANSIEEHRHTGSVAVTTDDPEAKADQEKKLQHLIDIHVRARAHEASGGYEGEEAGPFIDVQAEPLGDVGADLTSPTALASLRDGGYPPAIADSAAAEARAREAFAARGMPAAQIDRVVDRARGKAEREGRALGAVVDEMLAEPGRVG